MGALLEIQLQQEHNLFNARTDFNRILERITPNGGTRLRDSIYHGIKKILEINQAIPSGIPDLDFHFIHIILTDGSDQDSKIDVLQLGLLMRLLGVKVNKKAITNHFIGINMSSSDERQLRALSELGEDTSHFHLASSADTGKIFDRISASIQVQESMSLSSIQAGSVSGLIVQNKKALNLKIKMKRYIVVFNLDISGSMEGSSWKQVRQAVAKFTSAFKEDDLFSVILFNDNIRELAPSKEQMYGGDRSKSFKELQSERENEAKRRAQEESEEEEEDEDEAELHKLHRRLRQEMNEDCVIF